MSDFQRMPSQEEVENIDPKWFSDLQLAHKLYSINKNNTPQMMMLRQHEQNAALNSALDAEMTEEEVAARKTGQGQFTAGEINFFDQLLQMEEQRQAAEMANTDPDAVDEQDPDQY